MHGIVDKNGKFTISYLFRRLREKPETCASGCFLRCVKSRVELFAKKGYRRKYLLFFNGNETGSHSEDTFQITCYSFCFSFTDDGVNRMFF